LGDANISGATTISGKLIGGRDFGDGSDGALNITTGTTTLNVKNQPVIVKNYSSINISSGAGLDLSNISASGTVLILKSQGNCTIAGNIWAVGNSGSSVASDGEYSNGTLVKLNYASAGTAATTPGGAGGAGGIVTMLYPLNSAGGLTKVSVGGAGGNGGGCNAPNGGSLGVAGDGGGGGQAVILQCGGTLTFTGLINAKGGSGENATDSSGALIGGCGGGGGGAGGTVAVIYNYISTNTGVIDVSGGNGGNGGDGASGAGSNPLLGGGGGGGTNRCVGATGGDHDANGSNGTACDGQGSGGTGGIAGNVANDGGGGGGGSAGNYYFEKYYINY
jgi:hypothetical protein